MERRAKAVLTPRSDLRLRVHRANGLLIAHHHTYTDIQGMDYQILIEADFLVNAYEDKMDEDAVRTVREKIFSTKTGIERIDLLYLFPSLSE
ncbi:MAG: hypothetical protein Q8S22_02920 [Eubacteriales bacterium]|nr:hypothetical protein [Eubacteriales bacterium]